ncbi:hypothetical protein [Cupriavidus sp. WS]|uniref:hypothetical protein n=1 Tax=Cupriavidus sp. WS TaxID=1312922 RepID=UPI0012DF5571
MNNKGDAGGSAGMESVARAVPDSHTIGMDRPAAWVVQECRVGTQSTMRRQGRGQPFVCAALREIRSPARAGGAGYELPELLEA